MASVVKVEELPEIGDMVRRTKYGVKRAKSPTKRPDFSEPSRTGGKAKVKQDWRSLSRCRKETCWG